MSYELEKLLDVMTNSWRWSKTVVVGFPETESGLRILQKMLSISVLQLLVTLVGYVLSGTNKWEEKELRNSLVHDNHTSIDPR